MPEIHLHVAGTLSNQHTTTHTLEICFRFLFLSFHSCLAALAQDVSSGGGSNTEPHLIKWNRNWKACRTQHVMTNGSHFTVDNCETRLCTSLQILCTCETGLRISLQILHTCETGLCISRQILHTCETGLCISRQILHTCETGLCISRQILHTCETGLCISQQILHTPHW